jgi:hypothetical protein
MLVTALSLDYCFATCLLLHHLSLVIALLFVVCWLLFHHLLLVILPLVACYFIAYCLWLNHLLLPHFVAYCFIIVATLALGSRPRQRGCKVVARGSPGAKARGSPGVKARGSPGVTSHTPGSVKKMWGSEPSHSQGNLTLGDGVPVDSRNFRERLQGSNLNVLWSSLYYWKALEA